MFGRFPARSGFTTFCHQKVAPKVSARRKAAGNSQRLAKTGACRGFASKPAPFFNARRCSFLFPHFSQCGDCCALRATMIICWSPVLAGLRPAGSHCEKSGKIPTLHCIPSGTTNPVILRRKSKPIPTQASPPASPRKQRRKRPCPIGFRHICPKTEK